MIENIIKRLVNMVYYWYIDDRPRKQYLHILRELRDDIQEFKDDKFLEKVYYTIPPKIKHDDIGACIDELKKLLENESGKEEKTGSEENPSSEK